LFQNAGFAKSNPFRLILQQDTIKLPPELQVFPCSYTLLSLLALFIVLQADLFSLFGVALHSKGYCSHTPRNGKSDGKNDLWQGVNFCLLMLIILC
jgi:hypothetical protein